jgi:PAS domain S-box-containing protein
MTTKGVSEEEIAPKLGLQVAEIESLQARLRHAEDKVRASEERQRAMLDNPMFAVGLSDGNEILYANRPLLELFGYSDLDEFLSIPLVDHVAQTSQATIRDRLSKSAMGIPSEPSFVYDIRRKDGAVRTVEINVVPYQWQGRPCRFSLFRDVTERKRIDDALRESERKYRALVETTDTGYVILDMEGSVVDANPEYLRLTGHEALNEILGRRVVEWTAQHDIARNSEEIRKCLERGFVRNLEIDYADKEGKFTPIEINATVLHTAEGRRIVALCRDIGERNRSLEALREGEERFRLIAETMNEVFWVLDVQNDRVLYVSPAHERVWGYPRENIYENRQSYYAPIHPDDRERVRAIVDLMKTGRQLEYEYRIIRPDGTIRQIWERGFPIHDKNGQVQRYVGVAQDVTAWRHAEDALRKSTEYLNQLINRIGDPVFVKDSQYRFLLVNDAMCTFTGRERSELLGSTDHKFLSKEDADSIRRQESLVFETGRECIAEEKVNDGQNVTRTVVARKTLLTDNAGNMQIVGIIRDITEQKHLEAQFLQAQKMEAVGVLAGGVAHDFNNLLTVINGYSEFLLDDLAKDDPRRPELEEIRQAGQRAATLTSQLLAFGRKQILQSEILDVNSVIADMSSMLRRLIGEDIEFVSITQPGLGLINADPGQIQQIVMNLAVNARDAMSQGGKLTVETRNFDLDQDSIHGHPMLKAGPYVMLAISDDGIGMDAATQAQIFEPFFTTKEKGKGTGLGLSTVYGIVKQSNGFIWVYSEPGKGTTFKIYFPRASGEISELTGESKLEHRSRGSETVLVVEDEESVRALACRILRERGYVVIEAADGIEALRLAENHAGQLHLILTDIVMPGMSGKNLVSNLETARPGIKSLYMSGYTEGTIVHQGVLDSNVAFIQKPFTSKDLVRKVREVINS